MNRAALPSQRQRGCKAGAQRQQGWGGGLGFCSALRVALRPWAAAWLSLVRLVDRSDYARLLGRQASHSSSDRSLALRVTCGAIDCDAPRQGAGTDGRTRVDGSRPPLQVRSATSSHRGVASRAVVTAVHRAATCDELAVAGYVVLWRSARRARPWITMCHTWVVAAIVARAHGKVISACVSTPHIEWLRSHVRSVCAYECTVYVC